MSSADERANCEGKAAEKISKGKSESFDGLAGKKRKVKPIRSRGKEQSLQRKEGIYHTTREYGLQKEGSGCVRMGGKSGWKGNYREREVLAELKGTSKNQC